MKIREIERRKILRNIVQCAQCDAVLESTSVHDFQACEHIFTDGGTEYIRRGGDVDAMIDLTEYADLWSQAELEEDASTEP